MKKVLARRMVSARPEPRRQPSLLEYAGRKDSVLINRQIGGLGDILMHRMMFEDFKLAGLSVHFACPPRYHPAVADHPFLDAVLDSATVDPFSYGASYDTSSACGRHEMRVAPYSDLHRSDIWARHCGLELTRHDMHLRLSDEERSLGEGVVAGVRRRQGCPPGAPTVAVCPLSAMIGKDLNGTQITGVLDGLRGMGFLPFGLHSRPVPEVDARRLPMVSGLGVREWMSVMNAADYVIAVDTAAFHLAGGLGKPLVGVFSFADGKVYGSYFDFVLVQKHRDDGNWTCGPCYNWTACPKSNLPRKPCITEITSSDVLDGFRRLLEKTATRL